MLCLQLLTQRPFLWKLFLLAWLFQSRGTCVIRRALGPWGSRLKKAPSGMSVILSSPSPAGYNPITGLIVMIVAFRAMISEVTRPRVSGKEPRVQGVRWGPNNKKKMRSATQVLEHQAALGKTKVKKNVAHCQAPWRTETATLLSEWWERTGPHWVDLSCNAS